MKQQIKEEIQNLKKDNNKNFSLALVFVTIILFVYCYFGSFSFFEKTFTNVANMHYWKIIYHNLMAFVLFFVGGIIFTKFVLKQNLRDYGLSLKNKKASGLIILAGLVVAVLSGLCSTLDKGMTATYPLINFTVYGEWYFIVTYFGSYFLYYLGWEYLFRGLLLFASEEKCGAVGAILLTTMISALIHTSIGAFGKPMIETLSAIPAGVAFGYIAYKTRNINASLIIHFLIGICTDLFIFLLI